MTLTKNMRTTGALLLAFGIFGAPITAEAGGFAIREQSTTWQGSSFAGSAAGLDLSSMFWNPAAVTSKKGINSEAHGSAIIGTANYNAVGLFGGAEGALVGAEGDAAAFLGVPFGFDESGNVASPALVTSSYLNYQITDQLYVGLSINAPFGLTTKPDNPWAGQALGFTSRLLSFNAAPTVGYKITDALSVAAGVQVQYIETKLTSVLGGAAGTSRIEGDDIGVGWTLGVLYKPSSWTSIGLGFRSSISHTLEGSQTTDNAAILPGGNIEASTDLPEIVTFSVAQNVSERLKLLGTVEWTNWSRVDTIGIECQDTNGLCNPALNPLAASGQVGELALNYDDGWFFSIGAEYQWSDATQLRAGFAYEISPARADTSRTVRLADNDRLWFSGGVSQQLGQGMSLDLSYTYISVANGAIEQEIPTGGTFNANVEAQVNIVSAAFKMKLQ